MKIYFVRHGQTQYNKDGRNTGHIDVPLIEEGIDQAKKTAEELPADFDQIYSSDLIRCKQTTEIINKKLNASVIYDARLRERNFGSLEGQDWSKFDPMLKQKDRNQEYDYRSLGGESVDDVKNRVMSCVSEIQNDYKGKKVLVVTSGGVVRLLHSMLNNQIYENIHNASVHEFDFVE